VGQRRDGPARGLAAGLVRYRLEAPQGRRARYLVRSFPPNANVRLHLLLLTKRCYYRPWNYPILLSFQPIIGAIAAGCPAVLKPSEISPATSALLADLFPKYLNQSAYRVINGGVPEVTYLLKLKWDHSAYDRVISYLESIVCSSSPVRLSSVTYTGNAVVARIIAKAAAEHLTPVTLELGGKSPVIIDPNTTNLKIAAKRVLYGKTLNAGQVRNENTTRLYHRNSPT
jgi:aldehyde dehydrogenase family protein